MEVTLPLSEYYTSEAASVVGGGMSETCEEKSKDVSGGGNGGDGLARVPDTPHLSSSTHGPRPNLQVGTVNYYTASASKPMPPASAFPHPPSQSGTGAFRYRTGSFYSITKLVPASAFIFIPVPALPNFAYNHRGESVKLETVQLNTSWSKFQ